MFNFQFILVHRQFSYEAMIFKIILLLKCFFVYFKLIAFLALLGFVKRQFDFETLQGMFIDH